MDQNNELLEQEPLLESNAESKNTQEVDSPPSMEALLAQEDLGLNFPKAGETRKGSVVSITNDEILVSIGAKSEGIIPGRELSQLPPEIRDQFELGQEVTVYVVTPEDQSGNLILSYSRALEESDWDQAESYKESGEIYEGSINGYNKGGLIVRLGMLRGFVPASQISLTRRTTYSGDSPDQRWGKMVGEPIITRVIEVDRERRRLILSELAALQESREIFKERLLSEISEGDELKGRVTSLADFGAFVNINGADGLVHLTEISWDRITHPSQILKVGQEVDVKVINIEREKKRIGLSIRQLLPDPWPEKVAEYTEGQLVEGKIVRLAKFGAFARLQEGLEGLIHISELSDQRIEHPKEIVAEGEVVTLRVIRIDPEQHRIGLSLRKVQSQQYAQLDLEMALAADAEVEEEAVEAEAVEVEAVEAEAVEAVEEETPVEATEVEDAGSEAVEVEETEETEEE
jgi:small subunit ribosomal protein S1